MGRALVVFLDMKVFPNILTVMRSVASGLALPAADAVGMQLVFVGGLSERLTRFDLAQHLLLEFFGKHVMLETHRLGALSKRIPS